MFSLVKALVLRRQPMALTIASASRTRRAKNPFHVASFVGGFLPTLSLSSRPSGGNSNFYPNIALTKLYLNF